MREPHSNAEPSDGGSHRHLRVSGGYRRLRSFQTATLVYDGTVSFCNRFVDQRSRTHDQMVQAARSGRQNIAEGNRAGAVSSKSEMNLTNVARGSLDELLLDYQDSLRQRRLPLWGKDSAEAQAVRAAGVRLGRLGDGGDLGDRCDQSDRTDRTDREFPKCPTCGKLMTLRTARQGRNAGSQFWGCIGYPDCRGRQPMEPGLKQPNKE